MKVENIIEYFSWGYLIYIGVCCFMLGFGLLFINAPIHYYILSCCGLTTIITGIIKTYKFLRVI